MRLANVRIGDEVVAHVSTDRGYVDVSDLLGSSQHLDVDALITDGASTIARIVDALAGSAEAPALDPESADLAPAVRRSGKILCLGRNYYDHAMEMAGTVSAAPELFVRFAESLAGPRDEIEVPASTTRFDYEGELGVVIGKPGRAISADEAMAHVAGYVVTNDFTARDWQRAANQWTPGKNFDRTCPVGPEFVTADELGDEFDILLETRVNGETRQSATTGQLIVSIARSIEFISSFTTLQPGDLILTGTPGGVGDARKPPLHLVPGDVVETEIERVGLLRSYLVREKEPRENLAWAPSSRS